MMLHRARQDDVRTAGTLLMNVLDSAKHYGFTAFETQVNGLLLPEDR